MANEPLLLRKGSLSQLSNLTKTAGAISITTDVPGIYFDVDNNTRIRLSDFQIINDLNDLTKVDKLFPTALYYSKDDNALCYYKSEENKLVLINDTSSLAQSLQVLSGELTTLSGTVSGHTTSIGTLTSDLAAEVKRATAAEDDLQAQITALTGDGEGSIGSLEGTIQELKESLETADLELSAKIDSIYGGSGVPTSGTISTIIGNAGAIASLTTKLDTIEEGAEVNDIASIEIQEGTVTEGVLTPDSNKKVTIKIPKTIAHLTDGQSTITTLSENTQQVAQDLSTFKTLIGYADGSKKTLNKYFQDQIDELDAADEGFTETLKGIADDIKGINEDLVELGGLISDETTNRTSAMETLQNTLEEAISAGDAGVVTQLTALINSKMATADAMTFKGAVGINDLKQPNLPTGNKEATAAPLIYAGDTYVLSANIIGDHTYHVGDLFIARFDQSADATTYPSGIATAGTTTLTDDHGWYHVACGYDAVYESKMSAKSETVDEVTTTYLKLHSHTDNEISSIKLSTNSSNINFIATGDGSAASPYVLTAQLTWVDF